MRTREEIANQLRKNRDILNDGEIDIADLMIIANDELKLELLLDIRDLLTKE